MPLFAWKSEYIRCVLLWFVVAMLMTGCIQLSEEEMQAKVNKCTAAGMNYTYLRDFRGRPYDVMCVAKRLR